jgi:hypothetical protein
MSNAVLGKDFNLGALGFFYYVLICMFILDLEDFNIFFSKSMIMDPIPSTQPFHNTWQILFSLGLFGYFKHLNLNNLPFKL